MKKKSSKTFLLLCFIAFLIMGCDKSRNSISKETVTGAVKSYETCIHECDAKEQGIWAVYEHCMQTCVDQLRATDCPTRACLDAALTRYTECIKVCKNEYNSQLAELKECRKKCADGISILAK